MIALADVYWADGDPESVCESALVSASSNAACNLLYDALSRAEIPSWRFVSQKEEKESSGFLQSRGDSIKAHCLPEAARRELQADGYGPSNKFNSHVNKRCVEIMKRSHKPIVCTTSMSTRQPHLSTMRYDNVLVDEAAQATEPDVMQAVVACAGSLVLIGDHKQLPATVKSESNRRHGLEKSMFHRLFE